MAKYGLNIASMKTRQDMAPWGGTELFTLEGEAVAYHPLASNFDWIKIDEELQVLGENFNCDVEFEFRDMTTDDHDHDHIAVA